MGSSPDVVGLRAEDALIRLEAAREPPRTGRRVAWLALAWMGGVGLALGLLAAQREPARPAPAAEEPVHAVRAAEPPDSDAGYLAELGDEIERRGTSWSRELADAEQLAAEAGVDPHRISFRTDDLFAGTRGRPHCEIEGALHDGAFSLPPSSVGELSVRRYSDRTSGDGVTVVRTLEGRW